jgi:hypothetical protein
MNDKSINIDWWDINVIKNILNLRWNCIGLQGHCLMKIIGTLISKCLFLIRVQSGII